MHFFSCQCDSTALHDFNHKNAIRMKRTQTHTHTHTWSNIGGTNTEQIAVDILCVGNKRVYNIPTYVTSNLEVPNKILSIISIPKWILNSQLEFVDLSCVFFFLSYFTRLWINYQFKAIIIIILITLMCLSDSNDEDDRYGYFCLFAEMWNIIATTATALVNMNVNAPIVWSTESDRQREWDSEKERVCVCGAY